MTDKNLLHVKQSDVIYCYVGTKENRYRIERTGTGPTLIYAIYNSYNERQAMRGTFGGLMESIWSRVEYITPDEYTVLCEMREAE